MCAVTVSPPAAAAESARTFDDLRSFIDACKEIDDYRDIRGADPYLEIGGITEVTAESVDSPPLLLFDEVKGFPAGYRVVTNLLAGYKRVALAMGLPLDKNKLELVRMAARKIKTTQPIPPRVVTDGPILENVQRGADINLQQFPTPHFHRDDGGPYIGTGDMLISRDRDSGFVNVGTYRMQTHEKDLLGLWISPGQHGRLIAQQYWDRGESCPVVAVFGGDPLSFMASHTKLPWGRSELDFAGGLRGRPLDVIEGPLTGLPIPANAEIAIEGEVPPPDVEARDEGPYGEWPGYYSGGTRGTGKPQPVIKVKALYYRNNPILFNAAPMWPFAPIVGLSFQAGLLWDQLESAGIQDITGVYSYTSYLVCVAIKQRYPGHAKQAGLAVLSAAATARNGRYVVIVDDDIDPTNLMEVWWAMQTRADPATDIELIDRTWSTPLDPRMYPEKRASGDHTNSRAVFYAVRPFEWKDKYPEVSRTERDYFREVVNKYRGILPFPPGV